MGNDAKAVMQQAAMQQEFLSLVGNCYTKEEQLWISKNVAKLPAFLMSAEGRIAMGELLIAFKNYTK